MSGVVDGKHEVENLGLVAQLEAGDLTQVVAVDLVGEWSTVEALDLQSVDVVAIVDGGVALEGSLPL